ncbi:MAG: hypothetical protein H9802_07895 [Candidatus Phocaeicola faecipullorum]|nr:hypothetical protein [Candidatus Phocaeicola faecipullorum]
MDFFKIFEILSESYRKAIISISACSLIMFPVLYLAFPGFRLLEWYTQLLITTGLSVSYVGVFVSYLVIAIRHSDVFIFSISLLACVAASFFLPYAFGKESSLATFACILIVWFLVFFVACILLKLLSAKKE